MQTDDMPITEFKSNKMQREQAFQQRAEENEKEVIEEEEAEEVKNDMVEERPPMELFESIFGDDTETS